MYVTISQILIETTSVLYRFLSIILPSLSNNWWKDLVAPNLTFQQQRSVRDKNINSLSGLDLAALLRILKRNWSQIRRIKNIPSDYIHYVNEMSDVRNRWAHAGIEEFAQDDIYRDLDTLQRFSHCIEAEIDHIEKIRKIKESIFPRMPFAEASKPSVMTEERPRRKIISNLKTIDATRRPRNPALEASLKAAAGQLLASELGEPFIYNGHSLLLFKRSGKRFLCKYSSFKKNESRWWWGVPKTYWYNWAEGDHLILIFENDTGGGYSFLLLNSNESKELFSKCGESNGEKKINMRLYMIDGERRLVEWQALSLKDRMKVLARD